MKLPLANVALKYQAWSGTWKVAVSDQIPGPCLIGVDLTKHTLKVLVITRSQGGQSMPTEENLPVSEEQNEESSLEFETGRG